MERNHGLWHFKEKSADRLWHKSAIGKPAEGGGLHMNTVEPVSYTHLRAHET